MKTYDDWIGKAEEREERIDPARVSALAATLDVARPPGECDPLPPGWQWLFFNPMARRTQLGSDGHPARGDFLPPIELPRRMWAGSRVTYLADLAVGAIARKRSEIARIEKKEGRSGDLWFITVNHLISCDGRDCIAEEQDIVYRDAPAPGRSGAVAFAEDAHDDAEWSDKWSPDSVLLFRYSALTSNGHRIHYDQPYARGVEGYPDLVVHGPLAATILQGAIMEHLPDRSLRHFAFRGVAPICLGGTFLAEGKQTSQDSVMAWVRLGAGAIAMRATATVDSKSRA
jgi:3-methylfumaryl-CoA hydratase